jgi:hypothetical protein
MVRGVDLEIIKSPIVFYKIASLSPEYIEIFFDDLTDWV